jgi:hypothetical protein
MRLMGWSPLPETASECQSGEWKFPLIERGDRNEAQRGEGAVVLDEFDAGAQLKKLPAVIAGDRLGDADDAPSDAAAPRAFGDRQLADINAVGFDRGESAADQPGLVVGDDQRLALGLGAQLGDPHFLQ